MTETFYDVLGVPSDATSEEIQSAYRERIKESHPDLNDDEDAGAATRRVIRARDVLTDPEERERYDRIGHEAYVGRVDETVDDADVSDAAAAARQADWTDESAGRDAGSGTGRASGRRRARDRGRREREASQRVAQERERGPNGGPGGNKSEGGHEQASTASTDGGATAAGFDAGNGSGQFWNESDGFSVRQRPDQGLHRSRLFPTSQSLSLLGMTFLLYPVMVFSALFPPFPLAVNLVVAVCTVAVIGYLQSMPEVGVVVFGAWSLLTPLAFLLFGVELLSLVGVVALTATWLPLGLSILTLALIRP